MNTEIIQPFKFRRKLRKDHSIFLPEQSKRLVPWQLILASKIGFQTFRELWGAATTVPEIKEFNFNPPELSEDQQAFWRNSVLPLLENAGRVRITFAQRGGHTASAIRIAAQEADEQRLHIIISPEVEEPSVKGNAILLPGSYLTEKGWENPRITNQWPTDPTNPNALQGVEELVGLNPWLGQVLKFFIEKKTKNGEAPSLELVNDVKAEFAFLISLLGSQLPPFSWEQHLVTPAAIKPGNNFENLASDQEFLRRLIDLAVKSGIFSKGDFEDFDLPDHTRFTREKIISFMLLLLGTAKIENLELIIDDIPNLLRSEATLPPELEANNLEKLKEKAKKWLRSWLSNQPNLSQEVEMAFKGVLSGSKFSFVRLSSNPAGAFNRLNQMKVNSGDIPILVVGNPTPTEEEMINQQTNLHHLGFLDPITLWALDILALTQAQQLFIPGGPVNTPTEVIKRARLLRRLGNEHQTSITFLHPAMEEDIRTSLELLEKLNQLPPMVMVGLLIVIETFNERWKNFEDLKELLPKIKGGVGDNILLKINDPKGQEEE